MKQFLILLFIAVSFPVFAQKDTVFVNYSQEHNTLQAQRFEDRYESVFRSKEPVHLAFKWNPTTIVLPLQNDDTEGIFGNSWDFAVPTADLAAEMKLTRSISAQISGSVYYQKSGSLTNDRLMTEYRFEPRWYYDMAKRIQQDQHAANISGNYISAEWSDRQDQLIKETTTEDFDFRNKSLSLRFGIQRRLFRFGYIDVSGGPGHSWERLVVNNQPGIQKNQNWFFQSRIALGLALTDARKTTGREAVEWCDVLRCFQEDQHMWKADLLNLFRFDQRAMRFNPNLAYEHKLGNSHFSAEIGAEYLASGFNYSGNNDYIWKHTGKLELEPRWYFLQHRRVAKGKSGNNLAGIYLGLQSALVWEKEFSNIIFGDGKKHMLGTDHTELSPVLGVQHRLFRNGYVGYQFGVTWYNFKLGENYWDPEGFLSEIKIGLAI